MGLVVAQITAKRFYGLLYWATIIASTTFGTTLADFADRSLGIGYTGGSLLLGRIESRWIRIAFVLVLLWISGQMLWRGISWKGGHAA